MAVKKLIQVGNPLLRKRNKKIPSVESSIFKKLHKDLIDTMRKTGLIGIAAPQIGENYAVFITHPRNTNARKLGKTDKLRTYINPKITNKSSKENEIYEGCGSVDQGRIFGPVLRSSEIEVEAMDEKGKRFILRCDGILARVIQHEMDHLECAEFISKVNDYSRVIMRNYYRKNIRNSPVQKNNSLITILNYTQA